MLPSHTIVSKNKKTKRKINANQNKQKTKLKIRQPANFEKNHYLRIMTNCLRSPFKHNSFKNKQKGVVPWILQGCTKARMTSWMVTIISFELTVPHFMPHFSLVRIKTWNLIFLHNITLNIEPSRSVENKN